MVVVFNRGQLAYFRRKARKHHPNEILVTLVGKRINKARIEVYRFAYPQLRVSTPGAVETVVQSDQEILDSAIAEGYDVLGDIHTHPDYQPVMSSTDYKNHKDRECKITGILEVPTSGNTRLVVWRDGTPLPCKIKYFDKE